MLLVPCPWCGPRPEVEFRYGGQAGIEIDVRGHVKVNERLQTTAAGVWAVGDCAGSPYFTHVAYGLIVDDLSDFRPGQRAATEAGVRAPLAEAGLTKADVRALSRELGLPTADLPASPCLASRLPYGTPVTAEALSRVEQAEAGVRALGFRELRVRHLGDGARVEIAPLELPRLEHDGMREAVLAAVRQAGYAEVAIDAQGYRRGRLNEALRVVAVVGSSSEGI
jgi:uncharacterized protein